MMIQFDSISDFFNMGGYAFYVWLSYGVTLASFAILIAHSLRQKNKVLTDISKKMNREERLKEKRGSKS